MAMPAAAAREQQDPEAVPRQGHVRSHRSSPVAWAIGIFLKLVVAAVVLGALTVLVVVLVVTPHAPYMAVKAAKLQTLSYQPLGTLRQVQVSLGVEAINDNGHSEAGFSRLEVRLGFAGMTLAKLRADPFRLPARGTRALPYVARAEGVTLGDAGRDAMEAALGGDVVGFKVDGEAGVRWQVAGIAFINKWSRLSSEANFFWSNGTALEFACNSRSKFWLF